MKLTENQLTKSFLPHQNNIEFQSESINLYDMPDFLHLEKESTVSELYNYLTQTFDWHYYTLNEIFSTLPDKNNLNFIEWQKEIEAIAQDKKNTIINNISKSSKLLIESVCDFMIFLN